MTTQWTLAQATALFNLPLNELIYQAQTIHRQHFQPNTIQISTLLSIKTGGCPENCTYCPQSAHYSTPVKKTPLMPLEQVLDAAQKAKAAGASRFCMGAAWRGPRDEDLQTVCEMVKGVKALGLETCVTLGMLKDGHAESLKDAGLDFYNHNIDTSAEFYDQVITTRTFQDRLDTLEKVREADLKVCCGGIIGMGETNDDRIKMVITLANLSQPPESVPINQLIRIPSTPLANQAGVHVFDFVRIIALSRITMPKSYVRLSAGREQMSDEMQALCFMAGANSIFYGETLLTAENPIPEADEALFKRLGLTKL
jgi:biotin synthase